MANLDTLELTINGNATSASTGIDSVIRSLSDLSVQITKSYSDLVKLNSIMIQLKRNSSFTFPTIPKIPGFPTGGKRYKPVGTPITPDKVMEYLNAPKKELLGQKVQEMAGEFGTNAVLGTLNKKELAEGALQIRSVTDQIEKLNKEEEKNAGVMNKLKAGFGNMASGFTGMWSKVKRIATTMLIRSAIRGLIKSVKEGITNVREWAKVNNHEFYTSMDSLKSKTTEMKNALGASLTPTIQALIPVIRSLCNVVIEAANWINQLISLLTGKSYWIKATEGVDGYTDSVNSAGSAAKDWLATFDELNVMTSSSGGGSGSTGTEYSDMF